MDKRLISTSGTLMQLFDNTMEPDEVFKRY